MTRKDKKDDKLASLLRPAAKRDDRNKHKGKAKLKGEAGAALRARSETPQPRGSSGKVKKRRKRSETEPSSVPSAALDPRVLPHVDLEPKYDEPKYDEPKYDEPKYDEPSYELTADGDDIEALSADVPELGIGSRVVAPNVRFEEEDDDAFESFRPPVPISGNVEDQIRALEARLDGLIQGASRPEIGAAPSPPARRWSCSRLHLK